MQSTERRWVYFYDFHLRSYPDDAPQFDFDEVLDKVEHIWKNGKAVHQYRKNEITIRVKDFKRIDGFVMLLLHASDVKATDPAFSNTQTGAVRVEVKKKFEGIGAACHVLFSLDCIKEKKGWHLSVIEEVTGLPKSTIEQFLTRLFQISCKSTYKKPGSKSKEGNICRPMASFNGHASSTLQNSLKHSSLQGITLLNNNDGNFIDDNKELRMSEQAIKLRVSGKPTGSKALELIKKATSFGKEKNYDEVRVQYSEVVSEEVTTNEKGEKKTRQVKKQRTMPFNSKEADIANLLFTKSELIELNNKIGQCENNIHKELANNMKKMLEKAIK
ncbi:hypothetical protein FHG08_02975 [Pseudoalteromonas sp. Scap03]|uniref:hypothetical protein n=1 Tax=unclassified Pseudoalteromonas TaxID=194690 RepID=UPI0015BC6374|nr:MULTISPECIES: hypothetical protein [unclassified Pseudoalteromonas]NWL14742.1 hypothetical protein [Pseudoalteromonas sp. Scap03]QLE82744.1 hypothetical protein FLM54_14910 [Pseudoalteromonas sp. Scap25]QLE90687.1 hypothetical protein FLM47_14920 [Pseudoalteromonas sp. Scap06]